MISDYDDFYAIQQYYLAKGQVRDWAMWTIGVSLGLRISDLLSLKFCHLIDRDGQTIKPRIQIYEQKTGKLNDCPITESVKNALNTYLEAIKYRFDLDGYLFPSKKTKGKMYEECGWRILSSAGKALNLPLVIGSHTMRKSFANIAACVDKSCIDMNAITKVQGLLNHSDQRITMKYLGTYQDNAMLQVFKGHPLEALVYITLYYGLRRSEILGLRWSAVDFEKGTLSINHTVVKNRTIVRKDTTKTQSSHHTYMLIDDVRDALLEHRERQKQNRIEFGAAYQESDYIFTWADGTLYRPDYVTRGFQRVLKAHNIPMMRFHDLRHSTASILYDKGWDLKDSQSWLRHSSVEMTGDIYTHITEARKVKMAAQLNSTFSLVGKDERPTED